MTNRRGFFAAFAAAPLAALGLQKQSEAPKPFTITVTAHSDGNAIAEAVYDVIRKNIGGIQEETVRQIRLRGQS